MKKFAISAIFICSSLVFLRGAALAETYSLNITGNGSGGSQSIKVDENSTTTVVQQNNANIQNNVNSNPDTGGNSASGNNGGATIKTGDVKSVIDIINNFNTNNSQVACCAPTPAPTSKPTPPVGGPTPSPAPSGGGDGGQGGGGDGGSSGAGGGGGGIGGPGVLGLGATDGEEYELYVIYGLGLLCLTLGRKLLHAAR
jgi:hypothetical protein